jgi:hypothetical protein
MLTSEENEQIGEEEEEDEIEEAGEVAAARIQPFRDESPLPDVREAARAEEDEEAAARNAAELPAAPTAATFEAFVRQGVEEISLQFG